MDGSASFDPDSGPASLTYSWVQSFGTQVTLSDGGRTGPSFIAPDAGPIGDKLVFELKVLDGATNNTDSVSIIVNGVTPESLQVSPEPISSETQPEQNSDTTTASIPISITDIQVRYNGAGQFTISSIFNNNGLESMPFVAFIEVRDNDGTTVSLQFVKGTLYTNQFLELEASWTPPTSGLYEFRSFAVSDLENPQILSSVMSKVITINEASLAEPSPSNLQADAQCDESLWQHVYHSQRLKVINDCISVTGIIENIRAEADGDYHVLVRLDPEFGNLVNAANKEQNGDIVVEPVCQKSVTQEDAVSACLDYNSNHISIPPMGSHVVVTGSYVLDLEHGGWAEIHPATSIVMVEQETAGGSSQISEPTSSGGKLSVSVSVASDPITRGSIQVITVTITDVLSSEKVKAAIKQ